MARAQRAPAGSCAVAGCTAMVRASHLFCLAHYGLLSKGLRAERALRAERGSGMSREAFVAAALAEIGQKLAARQIRRERVSATKDLF
jgi:hypothetical protein